MPSPDGRGQRAKGERVRVLRRGKHAQHHNAAGCTGQGRGCVYLSVSYPALVQADVPPMML